jgi:hypothetical protein
MWKASLFHALAKVKSGGKFHRYFLTKQSHLIKETTIALTRSILAECVNNLVSDLKNQLKALSKEFQAYSIVTD